MKVLRQAAFFISTVLFLGFIKTTVLADCEIASFDQNTRNLQVCVGEFDTKEALRLTTASFDCLNNSNMVPGGTCKDITGPTTYSLADTPDSQIATDANGKFYTCITATSLNRAIGEIEVSFTGGTTCITDSYTTKPNDWNIMTEGMPWQSGTLTAIIPGSLTCPQGDTYINTALGCINTDVASGGFLQTILTVSIGLGGGIALLLMLYGTFIVTTSAGIPDKLNQGKEIITSAAIGLVFIILSITLMNLIGVNLLGIPGL